VSQGSDVVFGYLGGTTVPAYNAILDYLGMLDNYPVRRGTAHRTNIGNTPIRGCRSWIPHV
jgi:hypothetical protein